MAHRIRTGPALTGRGSLRYSNLNSTDSALDHCVISYILSFYESSEVNWHTSQEFGGLIEIYFFLKYLKRYNPKVLFWGGELMQNLMVS